MKLFRKYDCIIFSITVMQFGFHSLFCSTYSKSLPLSKQVWLKHVILNKVQLACPSLFYNKHFPFVYILHYIFKLGTLGIFFHFTFSYANSHYMFVFIYFIKQVLKNLECTKHHSLSRHIIYQGLAHSL